MPMRALLRGVILGIAALAFVPAYAAADGFVLTAERGKVVDFLEQRYRVSFKCPFSCEVNAKVVVTPDNARRLAFPFWRRRQVLATFDREGGQRATSVQIVPSVSFETSLEFPLFSKLPIDVVAHAVWDEPNGTRGNVRKTVSTSLTWPPVVPERGGRGNGPIIKRIKGPRKVSVDAKHVRFRVRVAAFEGQRFFSAAIFTAGRVFTTSRDNGLPRWVGHRRGTFAITLPVKATGNKRALRRAASVAPLAAELKIGFLNKHTFRSEEALHRFALTK